MAESYLSEGQVSALTAAMGRLHATKLAMAGGGTQLVLTRWEPAQQQWVAQEPQTVLVTWAEQPRTVASASGLAAQVDGWFTAEAPFNVEVGDEFALGAAGDEMAGKIKIVLPPRLGRQRAGFVLNIEER